MSPPTGFPFDDVATQPLLLGVVVGVVTQTADDPQQLNRIKVNLPTLGVTSAWARVASFFAGANRGAFFFPQKDDEVLVAFEQGDPSKPYVIGMLWNGKDAPPVTAAKNPTLRMIKTASGATIQFDDSDDTAAITIIDKNSNSVVIDTKNNKIVLTSKGDFNVTAQGNISLSAPSGSIKLEAQSVTLNATSGSLSLSGQSGATLSSPAEVSVSGSMIKLN